MSRTHRKLLDGIERSVTPSLLTHAHTHIHHTHSPFSPYPSPLPLRAFFYFPLLPPHTLPSSSLTLSPPLPTPRADSVTWNPHKSLNVPLQCSAILLQHNGVLQNCNSTRADYLFQQDKVNRVYEYTRVYNNIQEYARVYRSIQEYTGVYKRIQEYTGVCKSIQKVYTRYTRVYKLMVFLAGSHNQPYIPVKLSNLNLVWCEDGQDRRGCMNEI